MTERILKIEQRAVSLYRDEGKTIREIGELLGINIKTVRRILKRNNIPVKGSKKKHTWKQIWSS